jgi:elongation factor G
MSSAIVYPLQARIAPKALVDGAAFVGALGTLCGGGTFAFEIERPDGDRIEAILKGPDEERLSDVILRLSELGFSCHVGAPEVAYRETIKQAVEHDHTHKKLIGSHGEFARMIFRLEPLARGDDTHFVNATPETTLPAPYGVAIERGIAEAFRLGGRHRFPVTDLKVTLIDAAYHDQDSTPSIFETEAGIAFRIAMLRAGSQVLEPLMRVEVTTPGDYLGSVIGDLTKRRAWIMGQEEREGGQAIGALAPLANMFGYVNNLRAITDGRGRYSMAFERYQVVPDALPDPDPDFPGAAALHATG